MTAADAVATALVISLILYVLLGGADFGAGAWDCLCSGPRKLVQRKLIQDAMAPVWEANHVWLILAIVLLFTAFPSVFSFLAVVFHVPLTLLLLGIVFRGSSFVLRQYGPGPRYAHWGRTFSAASIVTPLFLGILIGAISDGRSPIPPLTPRDYLYGWLRPYPVAVGVLTLLVFMFLAAVYLTNETKDRTLQNDFRRRALTVGCPLWVLLFTGLRENVFFGLFWLTMFLGACTLVALYRHHFHAARQLAILQVTGILLGWAIGRYPFLIFPSHSVLTSAAPESTLRWVLVVLLGGAVVLIPSLYYLMRIFKGRTDGV